MIFWKPISFRPKLDLYLFQPGFADENIAVALTRGDTPSSLCPGLPIFRPYKAEKLYYQIDEQNEILPDKAMPKNFPLLGEREGGCV
jgi:hypothetical protein